MVRKYGGEELVKKAELALKSCKDAATLKRAMAVILTVKEDKSPDEAAKTLGVCVTTLIKYRREFSQGTLEKPKKPKTGNNSHLTWEQEVKILDGLKERAQRGEFTTVAQIKKEYEKIADCEVGPSTIYRFLRRHEWRRVQPRPIHPKTNPEAQEEFKKNCPKPCKK